MKYIILALTLTFFTISYSQTAYAVYELNTAPFQEMDGQLLIPKDFDEPNSKEVGFWVFKENQVIITKSNSREVNSFEHLSSNSGVMKVSGEEILITILANPERKGEVIMVLNSYASMEDLKGSEILVLFCKTN